MNADEHTYQQGGGRHCHGPLRVLGPGFKNHWCKLSSFLLRESIQSSVFLLFPHQLSVDAFSPSPEPWKCTPPHPQSCLCVYHSTLTSSPKWSALHCQHTGVKLKRETDQWCCALQASGRQAGEAGAAINWNSKLLALFWSVLDIRGRGRHPSTKAVLLLPERGRKKGASGMRPVLLWAPAAAHSRAMLVCIKRQTWWGLCSNTTHNIRHISRVPAISFHNLQSNYVEKC